MRKENIKYGILIRNKSLETDTKVKKGALFKFIFTDRGRCTHVMELTKEGTRGLGYLWEDGDGLIRPHRLQSKDFKIYDETNKLYRLISE